jgi:ribosomal protein L37E
MPAFLTGLLRVVVLLLIAAYAFFVYAVTRAAQETVGLDFATILASASFALVLLVPVAWVVALPDVPGLFFGHRARQRWREGRCPRCGSASLEQTAGICADCGADRGEPPAPRPGWSVVKRLAAMALAAWLVGCAVAEVWAVADEAAFAREAEAHLSASSGTSYNRPRCWPAQDHALYYTRRDGVSADPPGRLLPQY